MKIWVAFIPLCFFAVFAKDDVSFGKAEGRELDHGTLISPSMSPYKAGEPLFLIFKDIRWDQAKKGRSLSLPGDPGVPESYNTLNALDFETSIRDNNQVRFQFATWTENQVLVLDPHSPRRNQKRANPQGPRKEFAKKARLIVRQEGRRQQIFSVQLQAGGPGAINPYHCFEPHAGMRNPIRVPNAGDSFKKGRIEIHGMCVVAQIKIPFDAQIFLYGSRNMEAHIPQDVPFSRAPRTRLPREVESALNQGGVIVAAIYFSDREIPERERWVSDYQFNDLVRDLETSRRSDRRTEAVRRFVSNMQQRQFRSAQARFLIDDANNPSQQPRFWGSFEQRRRIATMILQHTEPHLDNSDFLAIYASLNLGFDTRDLLELLTHPGR